MIQSPSPTVDNGGRDAGGRFAAGNRFARGNPYHRQVALIRSAMLETVTEEDVQAIVRALIAKAKNGDVLAAREVLDRCLGKPKQSLDVEVEATQSGGMPRFEEMSDVEIATFIVENGMADRLPLILRKKLELVHGGQWEAALKLKAQQEARHHNEQPAPAKKPRRVAETKSKKKPRKTPAKTPEKDTQPDGK